MSDDTVLPFSFPAVCRKKVTAGFDGGRLTSDGEVTLLGVAERGLGIADCLTGLIADRRNPAPQRGIQAPHHDTDRAALCDMIKTR